MFTLQKCHEKFHEKRLRRFYLSVFYLSQHCAHTVNGLYMIVKVGIYLCDNSVKPSNGLKKKK